MCTPEHMDAWLWWGYWLVLSPFSPCFSDDSWWFTTILQQPSIFTGKKNWTEEEAWSFLAAEDLLLIIALEVRENARWMTNHTPPVLGCKPFRREIRWCYHPKKLTRKGLKGFSWGNLGIFQRFRFFGIMSFGMVSKVQNKLYFMFKGAKGGWHNTHGMASSSPMLRLLHILCIGTVAVATLFFVPHLWFSPLSSSFGHLPYSPYLISMASTKLWPFKP